MTETIEIDYLPALESRISKVDFSKMVFGKVYSDHMFVADYTKGQWKDFRIEPYDLLSFTPGSAILHYGQSVFEGLKAYRNDVGEILISDRIKMPKGSTSPLNVCVSPHFLKIYS
jgi:branched-chain amino acid aminotransferase